MLMFRELTPEENAKIEKFHNMKNQMADLQLQRMEKRKEIEFFEQRRGMEYVPVIIWGLAAFSQIILVCLDLFFGRFNMAFNWAIIFASMTPVVFTFCLVFFIKSLVFYIRKNSRNPKIMAKAKEKGIENRWLRSAKLYHELEEIDAHLRMLKKEYGYLKLEVDEIEANQYK